MGAGPPLLLIHGLAGSWESWLENIPALALAHDAIAVDLPGFGRSEVPTGEVSIPGYARFAGAFLDGLGISRAALVGSSMGGLIAADAAASDPERVERLVLVAAPGPGRRAAAPEEAGAAGIARALAGAIARRSGWLMRSAALRRAALGRLLHQPERISPRLIARLAAGVARPGSVVARRATVRNDVGLRVHAIAAPTLLVWGQHDRVVPPYVADYYAQAVPGARTVIFPDTGHAPMIERPALFNRLVTDFLAAT
jgi:pimeloyl-ACP methyl ester carboxylesterase